MRYEQLVLNLDSNIASFDFVEYLELQ